MLLLLLWLGLLSLQHWLGDVGQSCSKEIRLQQPGTVDESSAPVAFNNIQAG